MKKYVLMICLGCLFSMAGCNDDNDNGGNNQTAKCSASTPSVCKGNKLVSCDTATGRLVEKDCGEAGCDSVKLVCKTAEQPAKCSASTPSVCKGNKLVSCDTATGKLVEKDCGTAGCDSVKLVCKTPDDGPIEINDVPASQNNTAGAACDMDKFVEHCSGLKAVHCDYDEDDNPVVTEDRCGAGEPGNSPTHCAVALYDGSNYAACVGDDFKCTKLGDEMTACNYDDEGYEINEHYKCVAFNDGKMYYDWQSDDYCSNLCEDGCKIIKCNDPDTMTCSTDKKYIQECWELNDGTSALVAYDCNSDGAVCVEEDGFADCL